MKIKTEQDFKRAAIRGAWRGLRSQGFRKAEVAGDCVWRAPDGRRCAVGWLIPDRKLSRSKAVVHGTADGAVWEKRLAAPLQRWASRNRGRAVSLLWELQCDHDISKTASGVEGALRRRAKRWGVELPEDGE